MPPVPKYKPYRNNKILEFAKGQPCQHCNRQDGTTVAAHSNMGRDGKGVGKKSDDCFVAFLCYECHNKYDRFGKGLLYGMSPAEYAYHIEQSVDQIEFDQAMKRTWKLLLENGILK